MKRNNKNTTSNELIYHKRRTSLLQKIKGEAALFVSAPETVITRDQHHTYRQNSDLFYLTGIEEPDVALLILSNTKGPRTVLFLKEKDELKSRWGKGPMGLTSAKRKFKVDEVRSWDNLAKDLGELINFSLVLHYALSSNPESDEIVIQTIKTSCGPLISKPSVLSDSRLLTSMMRIRKEKQEILNIKHACEISSKSFINLVKKIKTLKSESHAAKILESEFVALGSEGTAFNTIVASGKNATVLHHAPSFQPLWKSGLVLIDAGAMFNGYCSDMTRTVPASGKFNQDQSEIYDIVLEAYHAALDKAQVGNSMEDLHKAAVYQITKGLVNLGILQGKVLELIAENKYFDFFMHRTGHWLGLDVHDIAPITSDGKTLHSYKRPLEVGNVITIEPGLYFDAENKNVPKQYRGIGIRIEDTVLITQSGNSVLTNMMPREKNEIENLIGIV